jgi:hypothetical protein
MYTAKGRAAHRANGERPKTEKCHQQNSHNTLNSAAQSREFAVYAGRRFVGTVVVAGRREFRAINAAGVIIGLFATQREAFSATIAAGGE